MSNSRDTELLGRMMAENIAIYNVTMTTADTQYSQVLPEGCKSISVSVIDGVSTDNFRVAFVTGKVAIPTAPYEKLAANADFNLDRLYLEETTVYVACSGTGKIAQIVVTY